MAWQREKVYTTSRTIYDSIGPGGAPAAIGPEYQPVAGVEQYWWSDRAKAAGWLEVARSMAFADAATLDEVARQSVDLQALADRGDDTSHVFDAGVPRYLAELFGAIMNYYNARNAPWYMHNTARMLYRQYMAGTPWNYGGGSTVALFSDTQCYGQFNRHDPRDYTGSWYRPDSRTPRATLFYGSIPQQARELFLANYDHGRDHALPHPTDFMPWFTLDLQRADGEPPPDDHDKSRVAYYRTVKNVVVPNGGAVAGKRVGPPGADTRYIGWDWWSYDVQPEVLGNEVNTTGPLRASAPPRAYLAWAQAWVTALLRQSPADVITEVIAYTAYCNLKQALVIGGGSADAFIGRALGVDGRLIAEQNRPDPGLQLAATAVAGVSAALTAVPVAGPIVAVIGGAVAAGIKLFDLSQTHTPTSVFFDDLGRPKPTIERNTLAGYVGTTDADSVAELYVPDPPTGPARSPLRMAMQTVRPDLFPRGTAAIGDASASRNFALARATTITKYGQLAGDAIAQTAEPGIPLPVKVALGLGVVYGLWQLVKPKSR